jgi:hypothetical protein
MRYLSTRTGMVHVVSKDAACPVVRRNADAWKGQRSIKPEKVLEMKDCAKCESFKHAREEVRLNKRAAKTANAGVTMVGGRRTPKKPLSGPDYRKNRPNTGGGSSRLKVSATPAPVVADERTTRKAQEHRAIAEEHGWRVDVTTNDRRGLTVIATKGDEICVLAYRENGILWNDEIVFKVPGRVVPMHNSGTWRRQVSLPEGQRPIPARPKKFGRKPSAPAEVNGVARELEQEATDETEGIPLNKSSLPFPHDAEDIVIVSYIKGRTLFWRNNMMAKVVSAGVPSKPSLIRFGETKHGRRFVSFPESTMTKDGEMWGAERSVAIEDMLRVR